jgi:hypothetical protein
MPISISSHIFMYADDMKIFRRTDCGKGREALQKDLDQLCKWTEKWQL